MFGLGRQFSATATTANFLDPLDDIGYRLAYRQPDLRGPTDPRRTELNATVFNTRKLSPIFAPGKPSLTGTMPICKSAISAHLMAC